jgi:hypothetical protein
VLVQTAPKVSREVGAAFMHAAFNRRVWACPAVHASGGAVRVAWERTWAAGQSSVRLAKLLATHTAAVLPASRFHRAPPAPPWRRRRRQRTRLWRGFA